MAEIVMLGAELDVFLQREILWGNIVSFPSRVHARGTMAIMLGKRERQHTIEA